MGVGKSVVAITLALLLFATIKVLILNDTQLCTDSQLGQDDAGTTATNCGTLPDFPELELIPLREVNFDPDTVKVKGSFIEEVALAISNIVAVLVAFFEVVGVILANIAIEFANIGLLLFFAIEINVFILFILIQPLPDAPWYINAIVPTIFILSTAMVGYKLLITTIHGES